MISDETVWNCWRKAGFDPEIPPQNVHLQTDGSWLEAEIEEQNNEEIETLEDGSLASLILRLQVIRPPMGEPLSAEEWVRIDETEQTGEMLTDDDLIALASSEEPGELNGSPGEEEDTNEDQDDMVPDLVTRNEAIAGLSNARKYMEQNMDFFSAEEILSLRKMMDRIDDYSIKRSVQTHITQYFSSSAQPSCSKTVNID